MLHVSNIIFNVGSNGSRHFTWQICMHTMWTHLATQFLLTAVLLFINSNHSTWKKSVAFSEKYSELSLASEPVCHSCSAGNGPLSRVRGSQTYQILIFLRHETFYFLTAAKIWGAGFSEVSWWSHLKITTLIFAGVMFCLFEQMALVQILLCFVPFDNDLK